MNKLHIPGRIWVASDIHLGPDSPATAAAFFDFLEQARLQADALILAGDIFDAWIGDDAALQPEPWLQQAMDAMKTTAARIPVWLGRGNRDFLIGKSLLRQIGAHALPEPVVLATDAGQILLAHGDEYCTADQAYQRFRRIVRNRVVQRSYLALPLRLRRGIANWARSRSRHSNQYKSAVIMDVEPSAIAHALRTAGVCMLIHGHTHRPARHEWTMEGCKYERLVLPDWDFDHADTARGGWIAINADGARLQQY